jgi:hypothetical protein
LKAGETREVPIMAVDEQPDAGPEDGSEQEAEVRRLGRHPEESPARRLEHYLDTGQLHIPAGSDVDRDFIRQMGSDNFGAIGGPAAAHMLGSVGDSVWDRIGTAYEAVTGSPQPEDAALRDELLGEEPHRDGPQDDEPQRDGPRREEPPSPG